MPARNSYFAALALMAAALPLAGCGTAGDTFGAIAASPGQYDYYDCPAIKVAAGRNAWRQRELEGLIARAKRGSGGSFVSATTYGPEYATLRGKMTELRSAATEKHCDFDPATVPALRPPSLGPGGPS